jgi:hypothetical protein
MPYVYFGYPPRNRGATKLAVSTPQGELEPIEPSQVKVFSQTVLSPLYSLLVGVLGLAVAIFTYPRYCFEHAISSGLVIRSDDVDLLPFTNPGLAVVVKKGGRMTEADVALLEKSGFTSMSFAGKTLFLKEEPSTNDFLLVNNMNGTQPFGPVPARYLHTSAFESWLILQTVTAAICSLFHQLTPVQHRIPLTPSTSIAANNKPKDSAWILANTLGSDTPIASGPFEFASKQNYKLMLGEAIIGNILKLNPFGTCAYENSSVVVNDRDSLFPNFITSGDISSITGAGYIAKFDPRLALPDPNLIGDVLGRFFMKCLGDSVEDQAESLESLKSGLAHLRLTRVGDELTHLFKCLEIAIIGQFGLVPFFTGSVYEGCVIMGGCGGTLIVNGERLLPESVADLKNAFLNVSTHTSALRSISQFWSEDVRIMIMRCDSMWKLRGFCLILSVTQDVRDNIIRLASNLDFGIPSWPVNPHNIAKAATLIANINSGGPMTPIARLALFSRDPVLLALSCFGEKTAPCWNIPNGISCSWSPKVPPSPLVSAIKKGKQPGQISDASWVMTVMRTDVITATEEFKSMAMSGKYRSTASAVAKKVGHQSYTRDRMIEFWLPMRDALRVVNPARVFDQEEEVTRKNQRESTETVGRPEGAKKRKLGFGRVLPTVEMEPSEIEVADDGADSDIERAQSDAEHLEEGEVAE